MGYDSEILSLVPRPIPELVGKGVIQAACGLHHTIFLTTDGKLYACGNNENGQLGLRDSKSRYVPSLIEDCKSLSVIEVACGYYHTMILAEGGDVFTFGRNDKGQLGLVRSTNADHVGDCEWLFTGAAAGEGVSAG